MTQRFEYRVGEIIGSHGCKYLGEREPHISSAKRHRKALFECGYCGDKFVTRIEHVKDGNTASCGCFHRAVASEISTKRDRELPANIYTHKSGYSVEIYTGGRKFCKCASTLSEAIKLKKQLRQQFIHD